MSHPHYTTIGDQVLQFWLSLKGEKEQGIMEACLLRGLYIKKGIFSKSWKTFRILYGAKSGDDAHVSIDK